MLIKQGFKYKLTKDQVEAICPLFAGHRHPVHNYFVAMNPHLKQKTVVAARRYHLRIAGELTI